MKNKGKKIVWMTVACLALLFLAYFSVRGYFLRQTFQNLQQRFKARHLNLEAGEIGFAGFTGVYCKDLVIYPGGSKPLLTADSVYLQPRLLALLRKEPRVKDLFLVNADLHLVHTDSLDNFLYLFEEKKVDSLPFGGLMATPDSLPSGQPSSDFGKVADKLISRFFDNTPEGTRIKNVRVRFTSNDSRLEVLIDSLDFSDNRYQAALHVREDTLSYECLSSGEIHPRDNSFDFLFYGVRNQKIYLPLAPLRLNARVGFDSARLNLQGKQYDAGVLNLFGKATLSGFSVMQEKISENEVKIEHAAMLFDVNIGPSYAQIDSASKVTINEVTIEPYLKFVEDDSRKLTLHVTTKGKAQDFFNSLPDGLFHTLVGIQATGNLSYNLRFEVDFSNPDELSFSSSLDEEDFKVENFGAVNLKKLNGPFLHRVYVNDRLIQSFVVGPRNPNYTPLEHISPYLIYAVINNEDGSFYQHEGFNEDAFRESIAQNIKEGAFVRGASTIPMQLVKNVFLSRDKTITRKLEEIMIVWLIEHLNLSSKRRMLEVYFNIIEFGPNIYGVSNGTRFYFNKAPSQLSLAEALFMSSIVPRPRLFRYSFSQSGQLLPYYENYFNRLTRIMLKRGQIEPADTVRLTDSVYLAGPAAKWFENYDPSLADSMIITLEPIFK